VFVTSVKLLLVGTGSAVSLLTVTELLNDAPVEPLVRSATLLFVALKGAGASSRSRALSDVTITDRPARSI
jgi:hypothetical protein